MHLNLLRVDTLPLRFRQPPFKFAQPQNIAVVELSTPAIAPIVRGFQYSDAIPASSIDTIITDHCMDSMVANTRPRNPSGTMRSNCYMLSTELTPTPARESAMNTSAQAKYFIWLNRIYDPPWIT